CLSSAWKQRGQATGCRASNVSAKSSAHAELRTGASVLTNLSAGSAIEALARQCRPGWSLPGPLYSDDTVYRADIERVWRRSWLFAGHACEIPESGDYLTIA